MRAQVKEELEHIRHGELPQNELRQVHWILRMHSLGKKGKDLRETKKDVLKKRIGTSQSRSPIYDRSPIQNWVDMFNNVFFEPEFKKIKEKCIKEFVAVNYVGLLQIRNYAKYQYLLREISLLLKYRWQNLFSVSFWLFSLGSIVMPPFLLIPMIDWYKNNVNAKVLKNIRFEYDLGKS